MKFIKRTFLTIIILTAVGILFRGWLFRNLVTYESVGLRTNYTATNDKFVGFIDKCADDEINQDIKQTIILGLSITSKQLNFTNDKNDIDPNKLINSKKAHCVGYASFFASTCNYLLEKYKLDGNWSAKPQVGKIYFLGTNIHEYFNNPFFKDHDFVTIENKITGEIFAVDPTITDYLYIDFVTIRNKGN